MKSFKKFIKEESSEERMAAQKQRQEGESSLIGRLEKHYKHPEIDHIHLYNYTADSSELNNHLWKSHKGEEIPDDVNSKFRVRDIDRLSKIMDKHKTPEAMTVWSKSRHDPRELKNKDSVVHHPAFLSTSIRKSYVESARGFGNRNTTKKDGITHHHVFKINVPKGHKGVYIPDEHSVDNQAKEFVLPKGLNMKHHDTFTKEDNTSKNHYHEHHLSVIGD